MAHLEDESQNRQEDDEPQDDEIFEMTMPPLCVYLRRILCKYPQGAVLKELVQNADDAKARNVIFLFDRTEHPRDQLCSGKLAEFQGPALYAYNDASFTKEDWKNIQHPEYSSKREDPTKVGRFGLGFISVFHLTDMPCILSQGRIGYLDPLEEHFNDPAADTTYGGKRGKSWKLSEALLNRYPDQFSLFLLDLFSCNKATFQNGKFEGTIFRFPLRKTESKLSSSVFQDHQEVMKLFETFQTDADLSLLFLKNVESIAVYERGPNQEHPRLIFRVQVRQDDRHQVRHNRETFFSKIPERQDFCTDGNLQIESHLGPSGNDIVSKFIIVNSLKNKNVSADLDALIHDKEVKFLPWMGMAFQTNSIVEQNGRWFCFLPLPESEAVVLPVHIHGYFGLSDDRRRIKWPDKEYQYDKEARWNHLLVTEVLPEVYAELLLAAIEKSKDPAYAMLPADVYKGWPCKEKITESELWSGTVKRFLLLLKDKDIFYTDQGSWMKPADIFINTKNDKLISKVLIQKKLPVAQLPKHILNLLDWADFDYQMVTPDFVRNSIRGDDLRFLTREEKLELLEYVISDCITDLNGLHLLPLGNEEFTSFGENLPTVYIASSENPSMLIPNGEEKFAASDMPAVLRDCKVETFTQLRAFCITDVAPLLLEMFPIAWPNFSASNTMPWTPGVDKHPSSEWLKMLWQWLSRNHMQLQLSTFKYIPLVPAPTNSITRLRESGLISSNLWSTVDTDRLPENICSFLESIGAIVIRYELPEYMTHHPHLKDFIRSPTPKGVMTILETMSDRNGTEHIYDSILQLSSEAKDELRNLLTQPHWTPTDRQKNILRHVPLFVASDGHYISAESCRAAVPANYFGIPVSTLNDGSKYIVQRDTNENLSSLVRVISERELLANNILPAVAEGYYELSESVEIMTWVLERPTFDDLTRKAKFIPGTSDTQLLCPDDLYEPIDKLKLLLRGKNVFPTGVYAEGRLLKLLQRFSLKNQSDISSADVLHAALELDKTQETDQADVARGRLLLEHINLHPHLLMENVRRNGTDEKPLHVFLKELHWVPCEASCPHGYPASAGWMGNSRTLYSPTDIGMIEFSLLCGSVRPLVDLANMQEDLLSAFAWKKPDPNDRAECQRVICHLKNISDTHQPGQETHTVSDSVSVIYQFLGEASDPTVAEIFETHLNRSHPWVWHGSGFTTPDKIALSTGSLSISLIPYLHIVPEDMQKYSIFLSKGGVQQTFSVTELCSVLLSVQAKHQPEHVPSEEEYQTDLNLVCNILKYIVDHANVSTVTPDILVPCRTDRGQRLLKMVPPCECLYVDQQRLVQQLYDKDTKEELNKEVIHESISNDVAQRLGLLPLSHFLAPTDEVEYETDGPHITPVNAIKQNLDMYKNNDVFKELIQNADDAGATEVRFLFDWRSNEKTASALLSERMKTCHGPALWVYNDARFSRHDIRNICSVAAQSKKHQTDKIGRFGLGFTSVYHLTDIPSVVSGPYVLICDPRTIHLGLRVKPGQPGIRIDLTNDRHRRTLRSYPNQFQPYNGIFGCDLTASTKGFDHTLFRLPLRTEFGASSQQPNQLSDFICDTKDRVLPLIESVKKFSSTLLLFTQNVVKVSLHELSENQSGMEDIMSVTVSRLRQLPRSISFNYDTAELKTERGLLFATTECIKDPDLPLPETTMVLKIAHTIHESEEPTESAEVNKDLYFITSSCMAKGDILDLAQTPEGEEDAVLPCGGIAAQLDFGDGDCLMPKAVEGSAFSYLPLSVLTGLPFHINGNFLLQPNRRQLWGKSSSGTEAFEVRWNCCFMETVLCNALLNLLQDLRLLQEQNVVDASNFQTLWPKRKRCDSDFHPLVDAFYRRIGRENSAPAVIVNQGQWLTVHDCFFTEWVATDPQGLRCSIKVVLAENQRPKTHVVLEPEVTTSISEAGANSFLDVNTFSVERFLQQVFFPALVDRRHIEHEHHNEIILHVLDLRLGERKITEYDDHLKTTKCIPVSPHGAKLVTPDYLVDPCAPIASLYSEQDGRFPYGSQYREQARLVSLTELGMASSDLPWEEICKRAESMRIKHQFEQQGVTLLNLMDKKLRNFDQPTPEQQERIRNAPFLPVLEKPKNYPASWFRCDEEMMSAAALFGEGHRDLLGSVKPLLDDKRLGTVATSPQIRGLLGIHEKGILVTDVMQHLAIIIKEAPVCIQETSSIVANIYTFLQDSVCKCDDDGRTDEEDRNVLEILRSMNFVLCDDGVFRECSTLAFDYNGPNGPYLFASPPRHSRVRKLLKRCGVKSEFEVVDYLNTLYLLKETYRGKPLKENDLDTAKAMMAHIVKQWISDRHKTQSILQDNQVFVPDNSSILRTPCELTLGVPDLEESHEDVHVYTHSCVTTKEAEVFGIMTQKERQLEACSSSAGFEMEFGQHEELVDRLRSILVSYPNISDVFKELLQNADDAKATEVHFVYDPRSHETGKIISETWAPIQRMPSLCVYNDKPFSEADISGIQKVGIGAKRDDITAAGRFGIGFSAIYHLTDCPSFFSNCDTLCVFDPLLKYVQGTREKKPGKRFSTGEDFREVCSDMLRGYLVDTEEFSGMKGTMFRFPLRTEPSKISKRVYGLADVQSLLEQFQVIAQDGLLFLNNVKKITISCVDEQANKLDKRFSISATFSDDDQKRRLAVTKYIELYNTPGLEIAPVSYVYSLQTCDSEDTERSWLISQTLGFQDPAINSQDFSDTTGLKKPLPRGGVAALIKDNKRVNPKHDRHKAMKAYCLLPLPISTNLPVHVNGAFELDPIRRHLLKGDTGTKTGGGVEDSGIHRWNQQLVQNVIAPAYAKLLQHAGQKLLGETVTESSEDILILYDGLFPRDLEAVHDEWHLLAEATLRCIGKNELKVLPVLNPTSGKVSWHHPNSCMSAAFFDNLHSENDSDAQSKLEGSISSDSAKVLRQFLFKVGFHLLASSPELCKAFQASDVKSEFVSPKAVVQHMSSQSAITPKLPAPLKTTDFENEESFKVVFKYCLDAVKEPSELIGLPLKLTDDSTLSYFSSNDGLYVTCEVLPSWNGKFLHRAVVELCKDWFTKNKIAEEAYNSGVFMNFSIVDLDRYLEEQLPEDWKGSELHKEWTPEQNGHPSRLWIKQLWKFISSVSSEKQTQFTLEGIKTWPIIPTNTGKLVPPCKSKTVLFLPSWKVRRFGITEVSALRHLNLPEVGLNQMFEDEMKKTVEEELMQTPQAPIAQLLQESLALPQNHDEVLKVIQFMLETGASPSSLSLAECNTLLYYFQEGYASKPLTEEMATIIRQLPLFKLLGDDRVEEIQPFHHYHTVEGYEILPDEIDVWKNPMKCVFLERSSSLDWIYNKLGISPISHADVYFRYIFPSFHLLTQKAVLNHVKNINYNILQTVSEADKEKVYSSLANIPFIHYKLNILRPARFFFDPGNRVFQAMISPDRLLPEPMRSALLRGFFKKLGLQSNVSKQDFIRFAQEIEKSAKYASDDEEQKCLCENAKSLKKELDSNKKLHDKMFLEEISEIKFIPSVSAEDIPKNISRELLDICPAFWATNTSSPRPFIAYRGSVPYDNLALVWSVSNVLPSWAMPKINESERNREVWSALGTQEKLAIMDKVLRHTKRLASRMEEKNAIHKTDTVSTEVRMAVKKVMKEVLRYLCDNLDNSKEIIKSSLQRTPICVVDDGCIFVRADRLVFDMRADYECILRPYLFTSSREWGEFDAVFKLLGASKYFTFDQLANVLSTMNAECGNQPLPPNELRTAKIVVAEIFRLLSTQQGECEITCSVLFLPSSEYILKESTLLYYVEPDLLDQLKPESIVKEILLPLKQVGLQCEDEMGLIRLLPQKLRPKYLSDEMHEMPCDTNVDCSEGEHCQYLAYIKQMVTSQEVMQAILRLIQHQMHGKEPNADAKNRIVALQNVANFVCKTELKLALYDTSGMQGPQLLYPRKAFFHSGTCCMYLEHRSWPLTRHTSAIFSQIAKCCNDILNGLLDISHVSYLQTALDCSSPDEMNGVLSSECRIPEYGGDISDFHAELYQPGKIVPRDDILHLLEQDPLNIFHKKEIVGYERNIDGRGAMVATAVEPSEFVTQDEATEMIYATIVDEIPQDEVPSSRSKQYVIDIGQPENITVSVTTLHRFLKPWQGGRRGNIRQQSSQTPQRPKATTKTALTGR